MASRQIVGQNIHTKGKINSISTQDDEPYSHVLIQTEGTGIVKMMCHDFITPKHQAVTEEKSKFVCFPLCISKIFTCFFKRRRTEREAEGSKRGEDKVL